VGGLVHELLNGNGDCTARGEAAGIAGLAAIGGSGLRIAPG
jgi:hypothetical protein